MEKLEKTVEKSSGNDNGFLDKALVPTSIFRMVYKTEKEGNIPPCPHVWVAAGVLELGRLGLYASAILSGYQALTG